jgi:hypothetical protein
MPITAPCKGWLRFSRQASAAVTRRSRRTGKKSSAANCRCFSCSLIIRGRRCKALHLRPRIIREQLKHRQFAAEDFFPVRLLLLVAEKNGATLYMVLLSAYYTLLSKYSGQEDIIVGTAAFSAAWRTRGHLQSFAPAAADNQGAAEAPAVRRWCCYRHTIRCFLSIRDRKTSSWEHRQREEITLIPSQPLKRIILMGKRVQHLLAHMT